MLLSCSVIIFLFSCKEQKNTTPSDTPKSGTIHISVDESFRPVIEEQIDMYERSYPGTHIIAEYKPESACFRDLFYDTATRLIIVTRGLTDREDRGLADSLLYSPSWNAVASDAVAIVVPINSNDTLFTLARLRQQLLGKEHRDQQMVFDGLAATSTVRFITDSVLKGQKFDTSVVKAAKNSRDVLDYVATHSNAIGLVGINQIGNPEDSAQVDMFR
jgi:phosphate transport system substrate-binding protein